MGPSRHLICLTDDNYNSPCDTFAALVNDSDPDGDSLTISALGVPLHGTAVHNGSTVTYTPTANYFGSDSFYYTISDGHGTYSTAINHRHSSAP